jgi:hypothetical protein
MGACVAGYVNWGPNSIKLDPISYPEQFGVGIHEYVICQLPGTRDCRRVCCFIDNYLLFVVLMMMLMVTVQDHARFGVYGQSIPLLYSRPFWCDCHNHKNQQWVATSSSVYARHTQGY